MFTRAYVNIQPKTQIAVTLWTIKYENIIMYFFHLANEDFVNFQVVHRDPVILYVTNSLG